MNECINTSSTDIFYSSFLLEKTRKRRVSRNFFYGVRFVLQICIAAKISVFDDRPDFVYENGSANYRTNKLAFSHTRFTIRRNL
jgi:hypothetical protein